MGKHEREWAEKAERAVSDGLNGIPQSPGINAVVQAIRDRIGKDYREAVWVGGNNYGDPGDVHVHWQHRIVRVELKVSYKKGNGTAKNLGQKILSQKIDGSIVGYQQWDADHGFKSQRYSLVEQRIGRKLKSATDYCQQLRRFRDRQDPIIEQIAQITGPGQVSYAQYASQKLNEHLDKVNVLVRDILDIGDLDNLRQDVLYCVVKNFETDQQTVEFFDFESLDHVVTYVESHGKTIKFYNKNGKDVLNFSVTWKNICQGGATPCFNVFVGNEFKNR